MSQKFTRNVTQTGRKAYAEYVRNVTHGENLACSKSYIMREGIVYDRVEQFSDHQAYTGFIV